MEKEITRPENEKKKWNPLWLIPIVLVIAAIAAAVALLGNGTQKDAQTPVERILQTPVGTLIYGAEWSSEVEIEDRSEAGQYRLVFSAMAGREKVELFELSVGADGTGYQLGTAPDADGEAQMIWLNIAPIQAKAGWSQEETDAVNLAQSSVNDLIEQIRALDGFREGI